jgi:hypothetical protein
VRRADALEAQRRQKGLLRASEAEREAYLILERKKTLEHAQRAKEAEVFFYFFLFC